MADRLVLVALEADHSNVHFVGACDAIAAVLRAVEDDDAALGLPRLADLASVFERAAGS